MDYPHGHGHGHHHHHRRDDEQEEEDLYRAPPPPPPQAYSGGDDVNYGRPSYPHHSSGVEHVSHEGYGGGEGYGRPRPAAYPNQFSGVEHVIHEGYGGGNDYDRPRPAAYPHQSSGVEHVIHEAYGGREGYGRPRPAAYPQHSSGVENVIYEGYGGGEDFGRPRPAYPHHSSGVEHVVHEGYGGGGDSPRQPTVRIFCKANENYSLSIRDGIVVLARTDRNDDYQHWIKDMKYSTRVKDEEGYPAFVLVNKATGEALKHSLGQSHPVRLIPYNPHQLDESVLWTESRDVGAGFRCIRMVNNIYLNFDAFHGDKDHGGVRDGTTLVLWEWCEGDNQRWKIAPY